MLDKCNIISIVRKEGNLKYKDVTLPKSIMENIGYHYSCCKRYTGLPPSHNKKIKEKSKKDSEDQAASDIAQSENNEDGRTEDVSTDRITRSQIVSPKASKTSGVFASACLFCGKERKKIQGKEQKLTKAETKCFETNIKKYAI